MTAPKISRPDPRQIPALSITLRQSRLKVAFQAALSWVLLASSLCQQFNDVAVFLAGRTSHAQFAGTVARRMFLRIQFTNLGRFPGSCRLGQLRVQHAAIAGKTTA